MNEANRPARRSNIIFCLSCFRLTTLPALLLERYHIHPIAWQQATSTCLPHQERHLNMSMADEWTFVPHRNSSSKRHHHRHTAKGAARTGNRAGCGGDGGLYKRASASPAGAPNSTTRPRVGGSNRDDEDGSEERIIRDVSECMRALEGQLRAGNGFAHRLMTSMTTAAATCILLSKPAFAAAA